VLEFVRRELRDENLTFCQESWTALPPGVIPFSILD
jgi:hypothetical protein